MWRAERGCRRRQRAAGRRWVLDRGDEQLRFSYDLSEASVVFDCGGYLGDFAAEVVRRYHCRVHCFEPVPDFAEALVARFSNQPLVICHPYGVGARSEHVPMYVQSAASGVYHQQPAAARRQVELVDLRTILETSAVGEVDLLKLNIEGGEFELLEAVLEQGMAGRFRHLQVQFHRLVPRYHERWLQIRAGLAKTHAITFDYYFVWENWTRVSPAPGGRRRAP